MKKFIPVFIATAVLLTSVAIAQPSLVKMKTTIDKDELQGPKGIKMKLIKPTQAGVLFKNGSDITHADVIGWLTQKLDLRKNEDQLFDDNNDVITGGGAFAVKKIHQFYKGVKVEHGVINATAANAKITMLQLEFYSIPNGFSTQPLISERQALEKALQFVNASVYAWGDGKDTTDKSKLPPVGELVILDDYLSEEGNVCLAYKFNIYSLEPLKKSYIYVSATDGRVVLDDPIIKHAKSNATGGNKNEITTKPGSRIAGANSVQEFFNVTDPINSAPGMADTRFNGRRPIIGDLYAAPAGNPKPYRLRATTNNHRIIVLDYERHDCALNVSPSYEQTAPDFTDNDNNWTSAEHRSPYMDDGATDVMDNMIWISDYWKLVHGRNSWNNTNGDVISYVHVWRNGAPFDNAYWNGENMHFGESTSTGPVQTSLDDCAHELGHGVTEKSAGLVYRWESGAINEGFSDIWAACVSNYAQTHETGMASEITWRLFEKSSNPGAPTPPGPGLRDMSNPLNFEDPSTYQSSGPGKFWRNGDRITCPIPTYEVTGNNDGCGVHSNSGVLNKWFYLITQGEADHNTEGQAYDITGLGFGTSQKIAYLTLLNLTPNSCYRTAMTVSLNATATLYGYGSTEYNTVKDAWAAVGVDSNVYNMNSTQQVFTTNNFTAIAVGKDGDVFAGTNYAGFYWFDGINWVKRNELGNVRFNDIKTDDWGDVWIAQSGVTGVVNGGSASAGGVNHLAYPYSGASTLYTVSTVAQLPTRNARCIYIDKYRASQAVLGRIWVATLAYILNNQSTSGMLGEGLYTSTPAFRKINEGIDIASNTRGCLTVGGNKHQIWTFVQANYGVNQLLVYSAETKTLVRTHDATSEPTIPSGFLARAIYGDNLGRIWIGLQTNGMLVYDENGGWHHVNFPSIFPQGTEVSYNGITGNKFGDVYVATNTGLVYFDAGGGWANRLEDSLYYRRYGKANGLLSNTINAVAYDNKRFKLWAATDSGIVAWDPPCIGDYNCKTRPGYKNGFAKSIKSGNWSDTAVWEEGLIPDSATVVYITDTIAVDINAQCQSLALTASGALNVNTGKNLTIYTAKEIILINHEDERRRRQR